MRTKVLLCVSLLFLPMLAVADVSIDETNFPDAKFRQFLMNESYGKDKVITTEELLSITSMNVSNKGISDLKGIEHFTALKKLLCYKNNLKELDLSANTQLVELDCYSNQIVDTQMDALIASLPTLGSGKGSLYVFDATDDGNVCLDTQVLAAKEKGWTAYYFTGDSWDEYAGKEYGVEINEENFPDDFFRLYLHSQTYGADGLITKEEIKHITSINVTSESERITTLKGIEFFSELTSLTCSGSQLTSLDVSKNTKLTSLRCGGSQLTSLDVSRNTALTYLGCESNLLTTLDVSNNTALKHLICSSNQLTTLDVSNNTALKQLNCDGNQLTSLVLNNPALEVLYCHGNQLTSLDLSNNAALTGLYCLGNQLTTLNLSKNTELEWLECQYNQLTTLDVSKNGKLRRLQCYDNQLTSLSLFATKSEYMKELWCNSNQLMTLDVSSYPALTYLYCEENLLTSLDLTKNTALTGLFCSSNQLTSLDVSKNAKLGGIYCSRNQIKEEGMDALIVSLPQKYEAGKARLYFIDLSDSSDGNVCTSAQVNAAKEKGWNVLAYKNESWMDYRGNDSDPTDDYRPFVEDGKVWKVGHGQTTLDNSVQVVDYYYFDGDTIIGGKTCKQMMCQRFVSPDYSNEFGTPTSSLSKVGAWYEEDKKVYYYDEGKQSMVLKYDFSIGDYETLQLIDDYPPFMIGPRQTGGIEGFKGVYRDVIDIMVNQNIRSTMWLEGVGGIDGPTRNAYADAADRMQEFLMSCTVGDEVIYLNDEYEDGATPEEARKKRFDFTHTIKIQPKARKRSEEQSLYGEYNDQQLGIHLDPLDDDYLVSITDDFGKTVYEKAVNAGSIVGLNIDISAYAEGRYTVTVENSQESFTGEFETQATGIKEIRNNKEIIRTEIYNLQGQRLRSLQKGLNIVNGQKIYVK